jgi:hypothetical protein
MPTLNGQDRLRSQDTHSELSSTAKAGLGSASYFLWVVAGILVGIVSFSLLSKSERNFVAADFGLGYNTVGVFDDFDGKRINAHFADRALLEETFRELRREHHPVALWIGNSQLHAINNPKKGDHLAVWYASQLATERRSKLAYLLMSEPNSNLHEQLGMYLALRQDGLIPDVIVLSFTYRNLQTEGIRKDALQALRPLPHDVLKVGGEAALEINNAIANGTSYEEGPPPVERNASTGTPQERIEGWLVSSLENVWPSYRWRGELRSKAIASAQIELDTILFKLFTPPKQPIPPAMQAWNERALEALSTLAKADGVRMIIYKAPYRQEWSSSRFDRGVYDAYHVRLAAFCKENGISYFDLGSIIPVEYWGKTNSGDPDYYHFKDNGHRLLGTAIDARLRDEGY